MSVNLDKFVPGRYVYVHRSDGGVYGAGRVIAVIDGSVRVRLAGRRTVVRLNRARVSLHPQNAWGC